MAHQIAKQSSRLRLAMLVSVLFLAYLLQVFWAAWTYQQVGWQGVLPDIINPSSPYHCLKEYHGGAVPESDLSFLLLQDYVEIDFTSRLSSNPECLEKLVDYGKAYIKRNPERGKFVIRLFDPATMRVQSKIVLKP